MRYQQYITVSRKAVFTGLLFTSTCANAQVWNTEVIEAAEDAVGQRLVFAVKESIRRSASMNLTTENIGRLSIIISAMARFPVQPHIATIYSVVWVFRTPQNQLGTYLDSTIGFAGTDVVQRSAEGIVARTDKLLTEISRATQRQ
jgi:hypothetical protein